MDRSVKTIIDDDRKIEGLFEESWGVLVGSEGITKIVPYQEPGQMGWCTWFAIYKGDEIYERIDSAGLLITYAAIKPSVDRQQYIK